jgi:hypothetical protein
MNKLFSHRVSDPYDLFKALQFMAEAVFASGVIGTFGVGFTSKILQTRAGKSF